MPVGANSFGTTRRASCASRRSPTAAERTSETLRQAVRAARDLPPSLADATPAQLRKTYKYVRKLTRQLDSEVATQLGVTINLSDADGDS